MYEPNGELRRKSFLSRRNGRGRFSRAEQMNLLFVGRGADSHRKLEILCTHSSNAINGFSEMKNVRL